MDKFELFIVGGGAAGMCAAITAANLGARVCLAERDNALGGILNQCLHKGFGRAYFGKDMSGTEYAAALRERTAGSDIDVRTGTSVLNISQGRKALLSGREGIYEISFDKCILSTGCRERSIGSLPIGGTRPAGIFTAGSAQKMVNLGGYDIGDNIVILGSGDVGQIMARRLTILGKRIVAMIEQNDSLGGLARNRRECIESYNIPTLTGCTIDEIRGSGRISSVIVRRISSGERFELCCGTLITAIGLIPERELILPLEKDGTYPRWLRLCGNCDYVHDIVDSVSLQADNIAKELFG